MGAPRIIPSPYHPLHGFRLKLNRAQVYATTLRGEIDAWRQRHPYEVFGQYEPGPPERYEFRVRFLELPPSEWGLILGDFAHNARSALDHLAYQVVMLGNGGIHEDQTQFPIVLVPWEFPSRAAYRLNGASARHVTLIESFQPYRRRDMHGWHTVWETLEDPLAVLNRLSNVDKHVVLNPTPAAVQSIGWDLAPVRHVKDIGAQHAPMGFLLDEGVLVSVEITSSGPEPEIRLIRTETIEVRVQHRINLGKDAYTLLDVPLLESLDAILSRLREIFAVFVGEFG